MRPEGDQMRDSLKIIVAVAVFIVLTPLIAQPLVAYASHTGDVAIVNEERDAADFSVVGSDADATCQLEPDTRVLASSIEQVLDTDQPPTTCRYKCFQQARVRICPTSNDDDCYYRWICLKRGWVCYYYG